MKRPVWKIALLCGLCLGPVLAPGADSSLGRLRGSEDPAQEEEEAGRMFRQCVALGIPEAELADLVRSCRAAGFASSDLRRVLSLLAKAKLAGLPHDDLMNKLREGVAKKASPEGIQKALEAKAQVLRRAKALVDTLLAEGRSAPDYLLAVKVTADALEVGASAADVLRSVRDNRRYVETAPDVRAPFRDPPARK